MTARKRKSPRISPLNRHADENQHTLHKTPADDTAKLHALTVTVTEKSHSNDHPDQIRASQHLIVVSLMSGDSNTGVETHFNAILHAARDKGISATLVTPYSSFRGLQRIANFVANQFSRVSPQRAHLWLRRLSAYRLRRHLRHALKQVEHHTITLYAQDPLSAQVALELRPDAQCRVVAVAHFNVSEAEEFAAKGVTRAGDVLWNALTQTEASALPAVDRLIFVSQFMQDRITARIPSLQDTDMRVLPHFTDPVPPASTQRPCPVHAVAVGSLEPRKNQQFLLQVIAACRDMGATYSLDVIGAGEDLATLKRLVTSLQLEQQVRFLGDVSNAAALIRNYRVFLHAATMESFGIVLIEALASSVPVLAFPTGGITDVFTDGIEGLYWDLEKPKQAAIQLMSVLENQERYDNMSRAALQRYVEDFHRDQIEPKWLAAIFQP